MIELSGPFSEGQFAEAGARPGGQPAHVVGDFHEGRGGFSCPVAASRGSCPARAANLLAALQKRQPQAAGQVGRDRLRRIRDGCSARHHHRAGTARSQGRAGWRWRRPHSRAGRRNRRIPPFEGERRCVLEVGPADLDQAGKLFRLPVRVARSPARQAATAGGGGRRHMEGGGKDVAGRLAKVDLAVGMHRRFSPRPPPSNSDAVGQHPFMFIGLVPDLDLPDRQGKLRRRAPAFATSLAASTMAPALSPGSSPQVAVGPRRRPWTSARGQNQLRRHAFAGNAENSRERWSAPHKRSSGTAMVPKLSRSLRITAMAHSRVERFSRTHCVGVGWPGSESGHRTRGWNRYNLVLRKSTPSGHMELAKAFEPADIERRWYPDWEANPAAAAQRHRHAAHGATVSTRPSWMRSPAITACGPRTPCGSRAPTTPASPPRSSSSASWTPRASDATTSAARRVPGEGLGMEGILRRHHHPSQMRRMGTSVDWTRERFTMDAGLK